MRLLYAFLLLLIASLGAYPQAANPPSSATRTWVFNFPQAPLEIAADGDKEYALKSKAKVATKSYRLGCVRESAKANVIIYRMVPEVTKIEPGEAWGVMFFHHNLDRMDCERRTARLSVIEVNFEDGTQWRAAARLQEN
jgi:hypothetical protein